MTWKRFCIVFSLAFLSALSSFSYTQEELKEELLSLVNSYESEILKLRDSLARQAILIADGQEKSKDLERRYHNAMKSLKSLENNYSEALSSLATLEEYSQELEQIMAKLKYQLEEYRSLMTDYEDLLARSERQRRVLLGIAAPSLVINLIFLLFLL